HTAVESAERLPCRDRLGAAGNRRKVGMEGFVRLRLMTAQSKRRDEVEVQPRSSARIDRNRPAGPFDRLIVLFQGEMASRFAVILTTQIRIVRTEPNRLVKIFEALFELPEVQVVPAQATEDAHHGGV